MAAVEIASVQEFSIAVDMCYFVLGCHMGMHWEGKKKKALPFNEVTVKLEELLIFFRSTFLFLQFKSILYLKIT